MKIQLIDINSGMCNAWRDQFSACSEEELEIFQEDFFKVKTHCFVSPANSFGFLDGGIDEKIRKYYERHDIDIQKIVWDTIVKDFDGELLVGQSVFVPVYNGCKMKPEQHVPDLIVAPTMRVPMILPDDSVNVYLAMKAIILRLKELQYHKRVHTVSISGLGTGIGQMPYEKCAKQMKQAYDDFWLSDKNYFPKTWDEAQDKHQLISTGEIKGDLQY